MGCVSGKSNSVTQTKENTINLLILGVGGCGKTTFVKQMKIIHEVDWLDMEIDTYRKIIRQNLLASLQDCILLAPRLGVEIIPDNQELAKIIKSTSIRTSDISSNPDLVEKMKALWKDPGIQKIVKENTSQMQQPNCPYFFDQIDQITAADYRPSNDDILRCRQRTAGAYSQTVMYNKTFFEFWDIGGQKPERQKWDQLLQEHEFTAVLYFVASDEYDVGDEEKEYHESKMELSRLIFSEIVNDSSSLPSSIPLILFINKTDILEERLSTSQGIKEFKKVYAEFKGNSSDDAKEFIMDLFSATQKNKENHPLTVHTTNALDTSVMGRVWETVRNTLLTQRLTALKS